MNNDTPRTNAQTHDPVCWCDQGCKYTGSMEKDAIGEWVSADFARELERENAVLVADRDSWCEQAEQRTIDAVEAFARAERAERENARLREALIEARNMPSERVRGYERYISALEEVCDSDQLARAQASVPNDWLC